MGAPALAVIAAKEGAARFAKPLLIAAAACVLALVMGITAVVVGMQALLFQMVNTGSTLIVGDYANPAVGEITSGFGPRGCVAGQCEPHSGTDIGAPLGAPFFAAHSGQVVQTLPEVGGIYIWDESTHTMWMYWHADQIGVATGTHVLAGQMIGLVGSKGNSTGPHLHVEIHIDATSSPGSGIAIDPMPYMASRGITLGVSTPKPITASSTEPSR